MPSKDFPLWCKHSIRAIAKQEHLYTKVVNGIESDEIENWFEKRFETPVQESYIKAINERRLTSNDWRILINYVASQAVRTPYSYMKLTNLLKEIVPNALEQTTPKLEDVKSINNYENFKYNFPIKTYLDKENYRVKIQATIGREMWLVTNKLLLEQTVQHLYKHKWSIVKLHQDIEIMTSDNPVIFLNYYRNDKYDFGGGWGKKGSEIIFPLSPKYIMYTHIGKYNKSRMTFNKEMSILLNKLIVENSFRYVYARDIFKGMWKFCPRIVDEKQYKVEEKAWQNWHKQQSAT